MTRQCQQCMLFSAGLVGSSDNCMEVGACQLDSLLGVWTHVACSQAHYYSRSVIRLEHSGRVEIYVVCYAFDHYNTMNHSGVN